MTIEHVKAVIRETKRFLAAAQLAEKRLTEDDMAKFGSKETAACRRASMDLTRALAELRR